MLATVIIGACTAIILYLYGWGTISLLHKLLKFEDMRGYQFPLLVMVGTATVTTLASYLSLVIPISGLAFLVIAGGAGWIAFSGRPFASIKFDRQPWPIWVLLVLMGLVVLENATHAPRNPDTALYHAQAIHWIEAYPAVPGLTNLYNRLGYNPSWFVLNAAFSFVFLGGPSFHLTGAISMFFVLVYFSEGISHLLGRSFSAFDLAKSLFFVLTLFLFDSAISSPATDMPAALLIWVTILCWAEHESTPGHDAWGWIALVLAAYAVTVKLSTLPLLLIPALMILRRMRSRALGNALVAGAVTATIMLPWILRNIILSGYLAFPLAQIDIFSFDWKYPVEYTIATRDGILYFARFPTKDWRDFIGAPIIQWLPVWFENLTTNQQYLVILAALAPLALPPVYVKNKSLGPGVLAAAIAVVGAIFWFISAPDIRFGYGFLSSLVVLSASLVFFPIATKVMQRIKSARYAPVFLTSMYLGYVLFLTFEPASIDQRLILPLDYLPSQAAPCPIKNGSVFCRKEGYQCNYETFPCTAEVRPNVELRGPSYRDGFRIAP